MANIKYNKTIEKTILNRLCNGESIRKICKDPEMVSWATFSQKLKDDEKLQDQYYNCKKIGIEMVIAQAQDKLQESIATLENGGKMDNSLPFAHLIKEMQSNAKWLSSVLSPIRYGKDQKLTLNLLSIYKDAKHKILSDFPMKYLIFQILLFL